MGIYEEMRDRLHTARTRITELERENSLLKEQAALNQAFFAGPDEDGERIAELEAENAALKAAPVYRPGDFVEVVARTETRDFSPHRFGIGGQIAVIGELCEDGSILCSDGDDEWYVLPCDIKHVAP